MAKIKVFPLAEEKKVVIPHISAILGAVHLAFPPHIKTAALLSVIDSADAADIRRMIRAVTNTRISFPNCMFQAIANQCVLLHSMVGTGKDIPKVRMLETLFGKLAHWSPVVYTELVRFPCVWIGGFVEHDGYLEIEVTIDDENASKAGGWLDHRMSMFV